jgi:dTDP-4-dehydrorhamnose 3,5-epimerase
VKLTETALAGVIVIELDARRDERGAFIELFHVERYARAGIGPFVQDNFSRSARGVLRGLHFQEPDAQGKLVQCLRGAIWDVAVDIRRGSPTFGRFVAVELDERAPRQLWIPPGFAHGFLALADADVMYKCTSFYMPGHDRAVAWNDPALAIPWPIEAPLVSARDAAAPRLADAPHLPAYQPTR